MATITVNQHLTEERAVELFRRQFAGKYVVEEKRGIGQDFMVRKSNWLAIRVKLRQGQVGGTTFFFSGFTPSFWHRMLPVMGVVGGIPGVAGAFLIMFLVLRSSRKELEQEIAQFIESGAISTPPHRPSAEEPEEAVSPGGLPAPVAASGRNGVTGASVD